MSDIPVTLFSARIDPDGVLAVLRARGATVAVNGPPWTEGTATWSGGFLRPKKSMHLRNSPAYYADDSLAKQLPGMTRFVIPLGASVGLLEAIRSFRFAVSMVPGSLDPADPRWAAVLAVAAHLDAVIARPDGIQDASGRWLARPDGPPDPAAVAPASAPPNPILVPRGPLYDRAAATDRDPPPHRAAAVAAAIEAGFAAPWWLPGRPEALRPTDEIVRRLLALNAIFAWVTAPKEHVAATEAYLDRHGLRRHLAPDEVARLREPGNRERHGGSIGWKLENMIALAWVLGHDRAPAITAGMLSDDDIQGLLVGFLGGLSTAPDALLARVTPRSVAEVAAMEDRFYVVHHAVRSAQLGQATVPPGFHPAVDGGVIHERRHALTWAVSPGVSWEDTDLST